MIVSVSSSSFSLLRGAYNSAQTINASKKIETRVNVRTTKSKPIFPYFTSFMKKNNIKID